MKLSDTEKTMLAGDFRNGTAMAMEILCEVGALYGAERMLPVTQAHIDGCAYTTVWDAGIEFAEKLRNGGARTRVPTTLNIAARDIKNWEALRLTPDFARKSERLENACLGMGAIPTWTCAPYQYGNAPRFGEHIAWAESNAVNYANSVLGARSNRNADLVDMCCAVTGRVPEYGFHLQENRAGQVLFRLRGFSPEDFAAGNACRGKFYFCPADAVPARGRGLYWK